MCAIELSTAGEANKLWWTREQLGTYTPTGEIFRGSAAVYKHTTRGVHLYRHSDCTWRTSEDDEHDRIDTEDVYKSVGTAPCPTDIGHWQHIHYNNDDGTPFWQDADITAKCNT